MVTALLMGSPGSADEVTPQPPPVSKTHSTHLTGVATRGLALHLNGAEVVNVPKISDPGFTVKVSSATTVPSIGITTYAANQDNCGFEDNPQGGTLNRLISVTVAASESANVYAELIFFTTDVTTGVKQQADPIRPFGDTGRDFGGDFRAPPGSGVSDTVQLKLCSG